MPTTTVYSKLISFLALSLLPTRIIPYRVPEESAGPLAGGQERGGGEGEAGEAVLTQGEGKTSHRCSTGRDQGFPVGFILQGFGSG